MVVRLKKTHEHNVIETVAALRRIADEFAARHGLGRPAVVGPPVLLADGFAAIEVDGRRLAVVGMILIGVVTLSAVHSLWWAIVPMLAGWVIWLATEAILATLQHQAVALGRPAGGPDHRPDDAGGQPPGDPLSRRSPPRGRPAPGRPRDALAAVAAPIVWTAITGAIGYGALVTSDVVPIQQFGAILGTCTFGAAILVMLISPIAMLPPFRLEIPVRHGSRSPVAGSMNRLILWVYRHPGAIVARGLRHRLAAGRRDGPSELRDQLHQPVPARDPRRRGIITRSNRGSAGSAWSSWSCRSDRSLTPRRSADLKGVEDRIRGDPRHRPAGDRPGALAGDGARPGRTAGRAARRSPGPLLADKLELIAASPQGELLRSFWNPETGETRILIRLKEQQPAPDKTRIFREATAAAAESFGPTLVPDRPLVPDDPDDRGDHRHPVGDVPLVGDRHPADADPGVPQRDRSPCWPSCRRCLSVALVLGLMGWLRIQLDMATALVASVALGLSVDDTFHCLLQFHRDAQDARFRRRLFDSYRVSGPGVMLSSLAVAVGFAALRASEFEPFVNFGTMVGIATAGSTLGNLVLLPACLTLGRAPAFADHHAQACLPRPRLEEPRAASAGCHSRSGGRSRARYLAITPPT